MSDTGHSQVPQSAAARCCRVLADGALSISPYVSDIGSTMVTAPSPVDICPAEWLSPASGDPSARCSGKRTRASEKTNIAAHVRTKRPTPTQSSMVCVARLYRGGLTEVSSTPWLDPSSQAMPGPSTNDAIRIGNDRMKKTAGKLPRSSQDENEKKTTSEKSSSEQTRLQNSRMFLSWLSWLHPPALLFRTIGFSFDQETHAGYRPSSAPNPVPNSASRYGLEKTGDWATSPGSDGRQRKKRMSETDIGTWYS